eukprot:Em0007g394a
MLEVEKKKLQAERDPDQGMLTLFLHLMHMEALAIKIKLPKFEEANEIHGTRSKPWNTPQDHHCGAIPEGKSFDEGDARVSVNVAYRAVRTESIGARYQRDSGYHRWYEQRGHNLQHFKLLQILVEYRETEEMEARDSNSLAALSAIVAFVLLFEEPALLTATIASKLRDYPSEPFFASKAFVAERAMQVLGAALGEMCKKPERDPEKKKASVRDSYKADPEKKASVRDSYNADIESKQSAKRQRYQEDVEENRAAKSQRYQEDVEETRAAKRQRYQEDVEENRAAKRQRYQEDLNENRAAKRQRYQEDVEENRAAKRQKYEDNSAAIKASERNWYWNDPAVRLVKRAAERKRYRRGHRTTQSYSLYEPKSHALMEYNGGLEKALRDSELLSEVNDAFSTAARYSAAPLLSAASSSSSAAPTATSSSSSSRAAPTTSRSSSSRAAPTTSRSSSRAAPTATSSSSRAAPTANSRAAPTSSSRSRSTAATCTSPTTGTSIGTSAPTTTSPAATLAAATTTRMAPMARTRPPRP